MMKRFIFVFSVDETVFSSGLPLIRRNNSVIIRPYMRKINLFLILTVVSLVSLIAVAAAGYFVLSGASPSSTTRSNLAGQMFGGMGGMMGGSAASQVQAQNSAGPYFGVAFVAFVVVAIVGVAGLVYFVAFPEIRSNAIGSPNMVQKPISAVAESSAGTKEAPISSVLKALTGDERSVVEVLNTHNGKYLQKYIRSETGFSRLQTHRIVARLAERGIVSLEKTGNTNTVLLANWLK
jgi:uncharacterized membrane protein